MWRDAGDLQDRAASGGGRGCYSNGSLQRVQRPAVLTAGVLIYLSVSLKRMQAVQFTSPFQSQNQASRSCNDKDGLIYMYVFVFQGSLLRYSCSLIVTDCLEGTMIIGL